MSVDLESEINLRPSKRAKTTEKDEKLDSLWSAVKCKDLVKKQTIHVIDAKSNVINACETLAKHCISSAPVWSNEDGVLCGMFDFRDLGAQLIKAFDNNDSKNKSLSTLKSVLSHNSAELASDLSQHNKFYTVNEDDPLLNAVEFFGQGIHRVCLLNKERKLTGILSQSDAINYFYQELKKPELKDLAEKSIGDLKIIHEGVVSLDENSSVLEGLKLMHNNGLSSIALIDKKGCVTGNFSISDIKYLLHLDQLNLLHSTCAAFIQDVRLKKDKEGGYKTVLPVFIISHTDTLEHVVGKLVATQVHRVWVAQSSTERKPVGVVSLSDILKFLTPKTSLHLWEHHPYLKFVPVT